MSEAIEYIKAYFRLLRAILCEEVKVTFTEKLGCCSKFVLKRAKYLNHLHKSTLKGGRLGLCILN